MTLYPGVSLEGMLHSYQEQYLAKNGWIRSVETRSSVDADGNAVPWLTYPANAFLARAVRPDFKVFEFGGGMSEPPRRIEATWAASFGA